MFGNTIAFSIFILEILGNLLIEDVLTLNLQMQALTVPPNLLVLLSVLD